MAVFSPSTESIGIVGRAVRPVLALLAACGLLAGCTDTPDAVDGRGNIRAVHAISDLGDVSFLIEGVGLETPSYQTTTPYSLFDSLVYDLNFDYLSAATGQIERLATTRISVQADTNYTIVLAGTAANPQVFTLAQPLPSFETGATTLELQFGHLARLAGDVDIYAGPLDFDPAATTPLASGISLNEFSAVIEIESGEYQLVATEAGQPGNVLMRAEPALFSPSDRVLVNLFDGAGESTGDYVFVLTGDTSGARLFDNGAFPQLQFVHAAPTAGNIDLYVEEPLTAPLLANVAPGSVSALTTVPAADDNVDISVVTTVAGNVGAELSNSAGLLADGRVSLGFLTGSQAASSLEVLAVPSPRRPLFDAARLGVFNAIQNTEVVDVYLVEAGEEFVNFAPRINNITPSVNAAPVSLPPNDYDLYIVQNQTNNVLLGPVSTSFAAGDVRHIVLIDTADPNVADVIDIDLLSP